MENFSVEVEKHKDESLKNLEKHVATIDNFMNFLDKISGKLYISTDLSDHLPLQDIYINSDKSFALLNTRTFMEFGVEIKEIRIRAKPEPNSQFSSFCSDFDEDFSDYTSYSMESQGQESPQNSQIQNTRCKEILRKINHSKFS